MKRWVGLLVLALVGSAAALGAHLAAPGDHWSTLVLVGTAIALGELIELRPPGRAPLPISFAFVVVLARRASIADGLVVLLVAVLAAFLVRSEPTTVEERLLLFGERILAGGAAILAFHGVVAAFGDDTTRAAVLLALALAALAPVVVAELARMARERAVTVPLDGRSADVALITSAVLMGISDLGVKGTGGMGLWGPAVFTIPLLAAWYSYEHLEEIRRTYDQTIRALGAAPELGGLVRDGHTERVANLATGMARELGFSRSELVHVETAALLHHLGQVCIDEPEHGKHAEPVAIAESGAAILRSTALLAPAGEIIAANAASPGSGGSGASDASSLAGQILKVASAFDELSSGRLDGVDFAMEAMWSAPDYLYDDRVLEALETMLDRRGLLATPA